MKKPKYHGINILHKIRKIVTKNRTGDVYGITIPKVAGKKYFQKDMVIVKNNTLGKLITLKTITNFRNDIFFLIPKTVYMEDRFGEKLLLETGK